MSSVTTDYPIYHRPRASSAHQQDVMPRRYHIGIQALSMAAFTLAFVGWLNETWLMLFDNPIWLNRYTEYAIILGFGIWRIAAEHNAYTRRRLIILVTMVTVFWWLIPWLYPFYEPYVGFLWAQPVFPSLHVPGTVTFFLILGLVFLFGRRIICGFNCPCVGIRETVGFAFRDRTLRSEWTFLLRHSKWFFFIYYVGVMVVTQFPPNSWTVSFVGGFYLLVALTYFGSFFIAPLVGNRFYCRYLCPYGATFGLLNHAGFYRVKMDRSRCNDCQRCEQVCDMGIPVWTQGRASGQITALEDCMGCARCVVSCPTDALEIRDVRNLFNRTLVQNASHLLKRSSPLPATQRLEAPLRPVQERTRDWSAISLTPSLAEIQAQASRCLDCGMPGCTNACPLQNRIPEWLEALAGGEIEQAAEIAHSTSNFPDVCGTLCPQHRLCEGACTRTREPGGAVTIGAAERFLVDEAFKRGWRPHQQDKPSRWYRHRAVAVIGAGPAGLACADELSRKGVKVTLYERLDRVGGLLASGVPAFKLDGELLERRRQQLQQQGVEFRLNSEADAPLLRDLLATHDALFLATGAQTPRTPQLAGLDREGVNDAISYLAEANRMPDSRHLQGRRVLIIGGGDTAMDCARTAVRQGAAGVVLAYRGSQKAMRASPKEQQAARDEGVVLRFEHTPVQVLGADWVSGVDFAIGQPGGKNSQAFIACDRLILAVGQETHAADWMRRLGIATDRVGAIQVDALGRTRHPRIYAGGDNTLGPELVVTAIAAGRRAAAAILTDLHPWRQWRQKISLRLIRRRSLPVRTRIEETPSCDSSR